MKTYPHTYGPLDRRSPEEKALDGQRAASQPREQEQREQLDTTTTEGR